MLKGLVSLGESLRFLRKMTALLYKTPPDYQPKVTVIVPCKDAGPEFVKNVAAIKNQNYPDYTIVFVTGSSQDSAYPVLEQMLSPANSRIHKLLTAGASQYCSQKIQNLLRALREVEDDVQVLVFADSDIRPHREWLRNLVAPLADETIGATTGYRWYMPMKGNLASAVRSVWNMTSANLFFSDAYNFAWGGSMAVRRQTFVELQIDRKWRNGLSDDMIVTQVVKSRGYKIQFVPQSIAVSSEKTGWKQLVKWLARQLTIVKVYDPTLWKLSAYPQWFFNAIFVLGSVLILNGLLFTAAIPFAAWLMVVDLPFGGVINSVRFSAFRKAMPHYRESMTDFNWVYASLHVVTSFVTSLSLLQSAKTRCIEWSGIKYEMLSANKTVVFHSR